jgi:high-affinity Fe2+/Pb2+ permease
VPYAVQIRSRDSVIVREVRIEQNKAQIEALTMSLNKSLAEVEFLRKKMPQAVYAGILVGFVICFVLYLLFKKTTHGLI